MPDLASQATKAALEGDWQKAAQINALILSQYPDNIEALNRLAHAFYFIGKKREARKTYQKVLNLDPYNHIAQKNLEKLTAVKEEICDPTTPTIPCRFLEEPGKTKVTHIVNPAPQKVLFLLSPGTCLDLVVKKHSVLIFKNGDYIGALPDDLSHRLINLTRLGNKYQAFVKAVEKNNLLLFLQELKRSKRMGNQPSFPLGKNNGFYPFVYSKQALNIDREPPEASFEDEGETNESEEVEEV